MALTYAEKLEYSTLIRKKFKEIKDLKSDIVDSLQMDNLEQYKYQVNNVFTKISVIEQSIVNLRKLFVERLNED